MTGHGVTVTLSHDEALVLFECLAKGNTDDIGCIGVDPAEYKAMCGLEAALEKSLTVILDKDYVRLVEQAKRRLMDSD